MYNPTKQLPLGVQQCGKRYRVLLSIAGVKTHCGMYDSVEEAMIIVRNVKQRVAAMPQRNKSHA
jgi:hypothetical protein